MYNKFLEIFIPIWYKVLATIESIFYLNHRKESIKILKEAKKTVNSPRDLDEWYQKNKFKYFSDKIDSSSLPWVVIHRKGGDCDDFMSLGYEILKDKFECKKVLVYSKDKNAHAILIVKEKDSNTYTIMSNYSRIKDFTSLEQAANYFYTGRIKRILYLKF